MINDLINHNSWFMYLAIALLSLAVGSLLNVIIYRLPLMLLEEWKQQCCELLLIKQQKKPNPINLFFPRSFCPQCKATVKAWQNIPLLSYLFLKGRCYTCEAPIPLRYPFIELLTLLLSLYASWYFGFTLQLPFILLAIWILITLFFIDLKNQLLPDCLTLGLLWLGLIGNSQHLFVDLSTAVLSAAGAYLFLWFFIKIFYFFTGKIGMGHGDFKLFAAFGAWFGWVLLPVILVLASLFGIIFGLIYLRATKKSVDTPIPFGPFLCSAGLLSLFWGFPFVHWYLHIYY